MTTINNEELRQAIFGLSRDVASLQHIVHPGVYEDISKRCELVLSAAKRLLDEGEKCAVLQSQVDNADVTLRQQKLCTEAERSKRQELERTLESVRIVPSPEDIASLRQQLDAEKAKVEALKQDRDFAVQTNKELVETSKRVQADQQSQLSTLTTANQRLREALKQWKVKVDDGYGGITLELCAIAKDALSQTPEATDGSWNKLLQELKAFGTSLHVHKATDEGKDKAIVDWLNEHAVYVPYVTGSYFRIEVATFFKRPPFREAILAAMARKTEGK